MKTLILISFFVATNGFGQDCGVERQPIKVGSDPQAASVDMTPIDTTVAELRALTPPDDVRRFKGRAPAELQTYTVMAVMTLFKHEGDSDVHIVLRDHGKTMIAEIPDPKCLGDSQWKDQITAARQAFESHFGGIKAKKNLHLRVRVTGVAFHDFVHGQTGVAPSGIELHPLVKPVEFLPNP